MEILLLTEIKSVLTVYSIQYCHLNRFDFDVVVI